MKKENYIDNYFEQVKQNPPLIPIEKVHQLINSPAAVARPKGKPRNFLKFTIMTTIFAIIVSAILLWPKDKEVIPNSRNQIPNEISIVPSNSTGHQQSANEVSESGKDTIIPTSLNENTITSNSTFASDLTYRKLIPFKVSNVAIIQSSKNNRLELVFLESKSFKIGEKDSSISLVINSGDPKKPVRGEYHFSEKDADKLEYMSFNGQYYISNDSVLRITGGKLVVDTIGRSHSFRYELLLENDYLVAGQFVPETDFNKNKEVKNEKPKVEQKYPEQILDSTMFIELNRKELENLGFKLKDETIELKYLLNGGNFFTTYVDSRMVFGVSLCEDTNPSQRKDNTTILADNINISMFNKDTLELSGGIVPMLITIENGRRLVKQSVTENDLKALFSKRFTKDFKTLLPVIMRKNIFGDYPKEDVVYWFIPTDEFFNRLPQKISKDLLAEYDYITADDKSSLVKPECKYFDECKNTLKVSNFKVYPNPANNQVTVSFTLPEAIDGRITLIDLAGRERQVLQPNTNYSKGSHQFEVDLSNVPEGIYLIALYSSKGIQTQRLIVAR